MSSRTFAEPKKKNSTAFSPILGKKSGQTLNTKFANGGHDMTNSGFGHNFGNIRVTSGESFKQSCPLALSSPTYCPFGGTCHTCPARIQTKLMVGQPGDKYEQEADRVAEQMMQISESQPLQKTGASGRDQISYNDLQPSKTDPVALYTVPPIVHEVLRSPGQPLDPTTRAFMESRFGREFSRVRVHTDGKAADSARTVKARAFTVGRDIAFGLGQYAPGTTMGKRLLAHELTHVMQQGAGNYRLQRAEEKFPCAVHAYDASDPEDTAVIPKDGSGIGVTSVADMVTKVNAYVDDPKNACSCVSRLEINGHGSDGNQSVGDGVGVEEDKRLDADSTDEHLNQLANIKFCPFGLFMMLGCHVGRARGKKLLRRLARILPGKLIGGAQHFTAGVGLGKKRVTGAGDVAGTPYAEKDPYLTSKYVRWHIVIDGKEYVINGEETTSTEGKAKLKAAEKIKVKTPDGVIRIK